MRTKPRLNLALVICSLVALGATGAALHYDLRRQALAQVQREAELQMRAAQAMRRYTIEQVRPLLVSEAAAFHPAAVPSHAATATMRYLHDDYPGMSYREVALNPINPGNRASGSALEIVQALRAEGGGTLQRVSGEPGSQVLHFAQAIRVRDASCLACHGGPQDAPAALLARYGDQHGFGWRVGETIGAQIVSMPLSLAAERSNALLLRLLLGAVAITAVLFVALNVMLRKMVINPMATRERALKRLVTVDALTGAVNRRGFLRKLAGAMQRARAQLTPLSLVMIDLDHFKRINDGHGHAAGDSVLRELVRRLRARSRRHDVLGRLGGEEFALLLPGSSLEAARLTAHALLAHVCAEPFDEVGRVTASLGVAQWDGSESVSELMARADAALYLAKHNGRARVECAEACGELSDSAADALA